MPRRENDYNHPQSLPTEGNRGFLALCGLAQHLGYDTYPQQMYNSDGTTVSGLINMLEDNPGMIEAMFNWVEEHRQCFDHLGEEDEDLEEEEESDEV